MMQDQVSMKGLEKLWSVVLPAPVGQAHSDVWGDCHVVKASSSCIKVPDTYDKIV